MQGGGFEPPKAEPAGLQPAPFGHSGTPAERAIVARPPSRPYHRGVERFDVLVVGAGLDGRSRATYLYHIVDNAWSMKEFGHQAVVWQTAVMPTVAIECLANGSWSGAGVVGPEALPSEPFLELLDDHGVEWEWDDYKMPERTPEGDVTRFG